MDYTYDAIATGVFPTRVGVNRAGGGVCHAIADRIPHACGGEPTPPPNPPAAPAVFPTRVGVNRGDGETHFQPLHVFPTRVGVNRR